MLGDTLSEEKITIGFWIVEFDCVAVTGLGTDRETIMPKKIKIPDIIFILCILGRCLKTNIVE